MSRRTRQGAVFSPYEVRSGPADFMARNNQVVRANIDLHELLAAADAQGKGRDAEEDLSDWEDAHSRPPSPLTPLTRSPSPESSATRSPTPFASHLSLTTDFPPLSESSQGSAARKKLYNKKRRQRKRQEEAASPFTRGSHPKHLPDHRLLPSHASAFDASRFKPSGGGAWIGSKPPGPKGPRARGGRTSCASEQLKVLRLRTLQELTEQMGYTYVAWDGKNLLLIVDRESRVICAFIGTPEDPDWPSVVAEAAEALKQTREEGLNVGAFAAADKCHRRGKFFSLAGGLSHGGGRKDGCPVSTPAPLIPEIVEKQMYSSDLIFDARQFVVFPTLMSSGSFIDVGVLADILRALLLAPEQLRDRHWMPDTTVAVFLRKRVRPVVYFLQVLVHGRPTERRASADLSPSEEQNVRMVILNMLGTVRLLGRARFIATEQIRCRGLPLVDVAEVGRDFGIPAQSTRMFAIIFDLLERFPPQDDADRQAYSLMGPILANLHDLARREAIRSGEPTEFPEYDVRGDITVDGTAFQFPAIAGDMHATSRFAVREEFQNLDIPTLGALHEFSCLPFIRRLVAEQLEPMLQYYVRIREQLVKSLKARPETDRNMTRQWLRSYMEHAGNLSDVIIRYKDLADARRIPTPPIPWLQIIMRAEQKFGFVGDEEPIPRATILARLSYAAEIRREAIEYSRAKDGVIAYIVQVLRPFAELIHVCIPSNALSVDQLPFGTYEQLRRFVVEFITQA
ncbi:hypothetical protein B0H15DRAFT_804765, partial [Mycena belliarum]